MFCRDCESTNCTWPWVSGYIRVLGNVLDQVLDTRVENYLIVAALVMSCIK